MICNFKKYLQIMTNKNKWLIAIGGLVAAAASLFLIKKLKANDEEKPPKGAPQLDLENPGSQHDFPKPPMESDIG